MNLKINGLKLKKMALQFLFCCIKRSQKVYPELDSTYIIEFINFLEMIHQCSKWKNQLFFMNDEFKESKIWLTFVSVNVMKQYSAHFSASLLPSSFEVEYLYSQY